MQTKLHILHLEDNDHDAFFVEQALRDGGFDVVMNRAESQADFEAGLSHGGLDFILVDNGVPGFSGLTALALAQQRCPGVPLIMVSGAAGPPSAELPVPVADFVLKDRLEKLVPTIRRLQNANPSAAAGRATHSAAKMRRLVQAVQDLSLARSLAEIMQVVRQAARELAGSDGATFVLRDGDKCHYADEEAIGPLWKGQRFPLQACISGWAMLNREAAVVADIYQDPRIPVDAYRPTFVKSLVMVPIRKESPIGAIGNYWAVAHAATAAELEVLQALATSTAVAMENVRLREQLERRVETRTLQLEATNRELEAFSYSVSHDLRAPLRAVDGFAHLVAIDPGSALSGTGQRYLQNVRTEAARMAALIEDLMRMAQLSAAEMKLGAVNLSELAQEILSRLRSAHPGREVKVRVEPGLEAPGDARLLAVVLENLLGNAWKYTAKRAAALIELGAHTQADGTSAFFVRDNGAGFDMANAAKLFAPFQRLHTDQEFHGSGVGLATVQRIIHRHGGRVWAEAAPGKGATFYFVLPPALEP